MSLLSGEEIKALADDLAYTSSDVRAIEAAILAKLASAELPEPLQRDHTEHGVDYYTAAQLHEAHAQGFAAHIAIEALQKEVSTLDVLLEECKMDWSGDVTQLKAEHKHEIEALQSKLGDAIQSSAHWQHQFTEAQAEIDLLKGYRDRALELATAYNNAQENIEQISAHRQHILAVNEKLTAQVDAMSKGEPVEFLVNGARFKLVNCGPTASGFVGFPKALAGRWVALVAADDDCHLKLAAPKALAPLTEPERKKMWHDTFEAHSRWSAYEWFSHGIQRAEAAHGIGGTP